MGVLKMNGSRLWLAVAALQALVLSTSCGNHRRSMPTQAALPSKGGWRPVVGSGGLLYGSFNTAPLHAPSYKIPVPVLDTYQSSSRPLVSRDTGKLTSIAQSYRPTTLRTVPVASPAPAPGNQPINSYHNPFAFTNNGLTQYKYVQNFPVDSVLVRNPHNPYSPRPVFTKYPQKYQKPLQNAMIQQLTNIQPIQFGQYNVQKQHDVFGKPVEGYARPDTGKKQQQASNTEIYKTEVFKLPDSESSPQSVNQQVKTAQQQQQHQTLVATQKTPVNPYANYAFADSVLPPSILGSFGSFGVHSVQGRDPVQYSTAKSTYYPQQPTKQTIFNSFSYSPNYKTTPTFTFSSTTPKLQTTANQIHYGSVNDFKNSPTQQTKLSTPPKIDPNAGSKSTFKPSPQDPFIKHYDSSEFGKVTVTTYNPTVPTTTLANNYYDYNFPVKQNAQVQNYYDQPASNFNYEKKKQKIHDSHAASINQSSQKYESPPKRLQMESSQNAVAHRPSYEVTEAADDVITHSSSPAWTLATQSYEYSNLKSTESSVTKPEFHDTAYRKPTTTPLPDLPEEYAIVTEGEKGYENSLNYDTQVESQSRRPLGDDFEPIGKHKLKEYYYKVSTPSYEEHIIPRRTKKPIEAAKITQPEVTTYHSIIKDSSNNDVPIEALPTLPPNKHFKRPSSISQEPVDKDRIRKRNKNRRRRPPLANINRDREESTTTTRKFVQSSTEATTEPEEVHTIRPRVRPAKLKQQPTVTTPSVTTDLTTSALPTISPTIPTIVKKKLSHRRLPTTISDRVETTTQYFKDYDSKESQIMKIGSRAPYPTKAASTNYDVRSNETPDYTHKQDEKDTPTSDIAVSLSDSLKTTVDSAKEFSFHKDVKPIEAKLEPVTNRFRETTTDFSRDSAEATTTPRVETSSTAGKGQRPRLKNKFNRPRFSVKDYRSRLSSTTSSTEKPVENTPKVRFPQRKSPNVDINSDTETTTERKRFTPKEPRHKLNNTENNEQVEKEIHSIRHHNRQRQTTVETTEATTQKISARIRNGTRRPKPTEETTETSSPTTTVHSKRPLRKKIKDSEIGESVQDVSVTETTLNYDHKNEITSERTRSESAIMKIADKKHQDHLEHLFEHSKRVSDLTLAASKDYNTPGMFKTVPANSRRIPSYFTIATDDPILPIEAFFPQLNQKKES